MNRLHVKSLVIGIFCLLSSPQAEAVTVAPPHDPANGYSCSSCHTLHRDLGSTGYNNICLNCHRPGVPKAGNKPFTMADFANPFNRYTATRTGTIYQTSHKWNGPDTVPEAGAQPPLFAAMTTTSTGNHLRARTGGNLACVRCHNQHDNTYKPFLRMANDRDQMCLDCHRSRNQRSHTSGTHPVNFNYTGATSKVKTNPALFNNPPLNANPNNPTSDLNARLARTGGTLVCSTCHGVHYSDSNSATFDNHSGFYDLRPSDGNLLRTDLRGANANDPNICTNCHAGKVAHNGRNQNIQCADCHGGHVEYDPASPQEKPNVWLVRRYMNVSTALRSAKKRQVFFQSTSVKNYKDASGTGVCQSCHDVPVGTGYPDEHAGTDSSVCNGCHYHGNTKGSFTAIGACNTCHGYPPQANTAGGPNGYAVYNGTPSPFTNESTSAHVSHAAGPYSRQCVECHQGNSHRSGTFQDVFLNTAGRVASSFGATPTFNGSAPSAPTCANVYCHSDGAPRNASLVPVLTTKTIPGWANGRGTIAGQPGECRSCHGDATTLATNSHGKHLAGSIGCTTCHNATVSSNSTIKDFTAHVNGVKDVRFGGTQTTGGVWTVAAATCTNLYCHSNVQGTNGNGAPTAFASPVWGSGPLTCGSCHTDMAADPSATGSHKKHAQFTGIPCATCHSGAGAGTALHANGVIENVFSGPAAGTTYSQANLPAGSGYGACTTSYCHSNVQGPNGVGAPTRFGAPTIPPTPPVWGGTFPCGSCHVNMATDASAPGSHVLHANTGGNGKYPCSTCHSGGGSGTTNHANHVINLAFTAPASPSTAYSLGNGVTPGSGYGSCANTYCHGAGTPVWGANTSRATCEKCHGSTATVPFYATSGNTANTDAKAGAHTNHLNASTAGHKLSGNINCTECHGVPGDVNAAGHMDTGLPAAINFGTVARSGGLNPSYSNGTCSNTWCHGAGLSGGDHPPTWNSPLLTGIAANDCAQCHAYVPPPQLVSAHVGINSATLCINCHSHVNATGTGFTNPALHINGVVDAAGNCDSCHGYPPASPGFSGAKGNYSGARIENYQGGGGMHTIGNHVSPAAVPSGAFANCDKCHNAGDHNMSGGFLPSKTIKVRINSKFRFDPAKQAAYTSNRLDGTNHLTGNCSNISCHFGATPAWDENHKIPGL